MWSVKWRPFCLGLNVLKLGCGFIQATKPGGVVVAVGLGQPDKTIPLVIAGLREIDIRGVMRYANWYMNSFEDSQ